MISAAYKANYDTLVKAIKNGDAVLVECTDAKTGASVMTVCGTSTDRLGEITLTPLAKLFDGNPYTELRPPAQPRVV